jgi:hypothetical protein
MLFSALLPCPGDRSPVFTSRGQATGFSRVLKMYGDDHWVAFFYLNAGRRSRGSRCRCGSLKTRPADRVHAVCFDQAKKGRGYPVALAEAHERAVVRAADRQAFLHLLTRELVRGGAPAGEAVSPTRKAVAKRVRGV